MRVVQPAIKSVVVVPYACLLNSRIVVDAGHDEYVKVDRHFFNFCMRPILGKIRVDEEWYLSKHADVMNALKQGEVQSARAHYVMYGFFENRIPYPIEVDSAIEQNFFDSAQSHFDQVGFAEGRFAYAGFMLDTRAEETTELSHGFHDNVRLVRDRRIP